MHMQSDNVVLLPFERVPFDHSADALEKVVGEWNIVLEQHKRIANIEDLIIWLEPRLNEHRTVRRFKALTKRPVQIRDLSGNEWMKIIQPIAVEDFAHRLYLCTAVCTLLETDPPKIYLGMVLPALVHEKLSDILQNQGVEYVNSSPRIYMPEVYYNYLFA